MMSSKETNGFIDDCTLNRDAFCNRGLGAATGARPQPPPWLHRSRMLQLSAPICFRTVFRFAKLFFEKKSFFLLLLWVRCKFNELSLWVTIWARSRRGASFAAVRARPTRRRSLLLGPFPPCLKQLSGGFFIFRSREHNKAYAHCRNRFCASRAHSFPPSFCLFPPSLQTIVC